MNRASGGAARDNVPPSINVSDESCWWSWGWYVQFSAPLFDFTNYTTVSQDNAMITLGNDTAAHTYSNYSFGTYQNSSFQVNRTSYSRQSPRSNATKTCLGDGTFSGQGDLWLNNSYQVGGKFYNDTMLASHRYILSLEFTVQDWAVAATYGPQPGQPTLHGLVGAGFKTNVATNRNSAHLTSVVL